MSGMLDILGPAYARSIHFWKALVYSAALQGLVMGAVAIAYHRIKTALSEATWFNGEYVEALRIGETINSTAAALSGGNFTYDPAALDSLRLGQGEWWYVGMLAGAGFAVGLLKVLWTAAFPKNPFPEKLHGFIKELIGLEAKDLLLPIPALLASDLSMGLGASVGPEIALASCGSALGTLIARRWRIGSVQAQSRIHEIREREEEEEKANPPISCWKRVLSRALPDFSHRKDLCALEGMSAAMAGVFPAQYLSPLLVHEVGNHWGPGGRFAVTETVACTGVAATFAYAVFVGVQNKPFLGPLDLTFVLFQIENEFQALYLLYGALLGIISGIVGFIGFLCLAIFNLLGMSVARNLNELGSRLGWPDTRDDVLGKLFTPVIGGTIVGLLYVATPLNLGEGGSQILAVMTLGRELGMGTLIVTALLKMVCLGICLGFGFIGGPIIPFLFVGACTGTVMNMLIPDIPILISYTCCFAAVPAAIVPGVFTFTSLASLSFVLSGPATAPVFVACIMSYSTVCGLGLLQNLLLRAAGKDKENGAGEYDDVEVDESMEADHALNPLIQDSWTARSRGSVSSRQEFASPTPSTESLPVHKPLETEE